MTNPRRRGNLHHRLTHPDVLGRARLVPWIDYARQPHTDTPKK